MNWTDEEVEKLKAKYLSGANEVECPTCGGKVIILKLEGKEHLKKKFVDTHFFLEFECSGCGRKDTRTYRKHP